jgi:glycosyltransferase involved in cell wall biosynthesis
LLGEEVLLRVLFTLSHVYLPYALAGTETNTDQLCKALQARGDSVGVLSGLSRKTYMGVRNNVCCRIHRVACGPPDDICGYPVWRSPDGVYDLRKAFPQVLQNYRPDVVVAQQQYAPELADWATMILHIPALVYIHSADFRWLGLHRMADYSHLRFLANSQYTAKRLQDEHGITAMVLYNLFDPAQYKTPLIGKYVTFINPHRDKGGELAFRLAEECSDIPFLFVGAWLGPLDKDYRLRIKMLRNVTWVPATPRMKTVYEQTRILIVPSRIEETWGRVVTEAQFSGIPVLASDRGGLPEAVGNGGIVLSNDHPATWRSALVRLWRDERRWNDLSQKALAHAARAEIQPAAVVGNLVTEIQSMLPR